MKDTPEIKRLKARIALLERALDKAEQQRLSMEEVREAIFGLTAEPPRPPRWPTIKNLSARDTPGTPVLLLSDWHAGEVVRAPEVAGVNRFNREVLRRRVKTVLEHSLLLIKKYQVNAHYDGIVVGLLGDMVTGEIHDELARTNDLAPLPAVLEVRDLLHAFLLRMKAEFGRVFVPCVAGNHGRTDRKPSTKQFSERNLDWLIYTLLERDFKDDPAITIMAPLCNEAEFEVHGLRVLAVHGHDLGVKGGDGIIGAVGPIMRGRLKIGQQKAALGKDIDLLVMGHWHQYLILPGVVVNNSLKGWDEFSAHHLRAKPSRPSQALFFIHPKHGVTSHWQVFAEEKDATRRGKP